MYAQPICFVFTEVTVGLRILESDYGAVYTVYEGNVTEVCADLIGSLERPVNVSVDGRHINRHFNLYCSLIT